MYVAPKSVSGRVVKTRSTRSPGSSGKPERLRTGHLAGLRTPALILQGTRDPFGTRDEVADYDLSPAIRLQWLEDGDHGFKPRQASGRTEAANWEEAIAAIASFTSGL